MKEDNVEKIKKMYEPLRKKYKLPTFNDIDREFEIRKASPDGFVLKETRRLIILKFEQIGHWFAPVLEPRPESIHTHVEMDSFGKKDRHELILFFKKLTCYMHKGMTLDLGCTEKEDANYIKEVWKQLPDIKKQGKKFMSKLIDSWSKVHKVPEEKMDYMG